MGQIMFTKRADLRLKAVLGIAILATGGTLGACSRADREAPAAAAQSGAVGRAAVDGARIIGADSEPGSWTATTPSVTSSWARLAMSRS